MGKKKFLICQWALTQVSISHHGEHWPSEHNLWLFNVETPSHCCSKPFGHHPGENWEYMWGRLAQKKPERCCFCGQTCQYFPGGSEGQKAKEPCVGARCLQAAFRWSLSMFSRSSRVTWGETFAMLSLSFFSPFSQTHSMCLTGRFTLWKVVVEIQTLVYNCALISLWS